MDRGKLIDSIEALVALNDAGALVPHGIGGHARTLLTEAAAALSAPDDAATGCAEREVGRWVYNRVSSLMDAKPGTPEDRELGYLSRMVSDVEEYGATGAEGDPSEFAEPPRPTREEVIEAVHKWLAECALHYHSGAPKPFPTLKQIDSLTDAMLALFSGGGR